MPELRRRNANGTAKTSLSTSALSQSTTPVSTKKTATSVKKSPAKAATGAKKSAPKKKASPTKKATPKKSAVKAAKVTKPSPRKLSSAKKLQYVAEPCPMRRRYLVWPPHAFVHDIPRTKVDSYKRQIGGPNYAAKADTVDPRPALSGHPPYTQDVRDDRKARECIGWKALYQVNFRCPKSGNLRAVCVEPGWENIHSGGREVWFNPKHAPWDIGFKARRAFTKQGLIHLGYTLKNDGQGWWGKRDGQGEIETDQSLKGYGQDGVWWTDHGLAVGELDNLTYGLH